MDFKLYLLRKSRSKNKEDDTRILSTRYLITVHLRQTYIYVLNAFTEANKDS